MTPRFRDLEGKVAVVTGGSAGIGAATCRALAENGVRIVVAARGAERVDAVAAELRAAGAEAVGITADASRMEDVLRLRAVALEAFGTIDLLLPFAGGFAGPDPADRDRGGRVASGDRRQSHRHVPRTTGVRADMVEQRRGAIVTMASSAGRVLDVRITASYAAAKAGIVQLTRHAAYELGPHNVRVNCVAPATVLSERVDQGHHARAAGEGNRPLPPRPARAPGGCGKCCALFALGRCRLADRHHARRRRWPSHALTPDQRCGSVARAQDHVGELGSLPLVENARLGSVVEARLTIVGQAAQLARALDVDRDHEQPRLR